MRFFAEKVLVGKKQEAESGTGPVNSETMDTFFGPQRQEYAVGIESVSQLGVSWVSGIKLKLMFPVIGNYPFKFEVDRFKS